MIPYKVDERSFNAMKINARTNIIIHIILKEAFIKLDSI